MAYKRRLRFDKRIKFRKSMSIMYILLFVVLASLGVGYSYIKSNLNINGTANVTAANWDVHFANLNVTTGSVTATTAASITNPNTVTFAATLDEPNDFYEFTVDVVNAGTMDAMINDFSIRPTLTTAQAKYLGYTITYEDGIELENKQELKTGTTETLKVRFSYIENSDKTNYPTGDQNFNIEFSVDYIQADNTAAEIRDIRYTVNTEQEIRSNQAIPATITQYDTAADAMAAFSNRPFYLKHIIKNGVAAISYVEFVVTPTMASANPGMTAGTYALRGIDTYKRESSSTSYCKPEYYNSVTMKCLSPYYESNKAKLLSAFGSANCMEDLGQFYCSVTGLLASCSDRGNAYVSNNSWGCEYSPSDDAIILCNPEEG